MAVTSDQAISAAMRGAVRALHAVPPPESGAELMVDYGEFLQETANACGNAMTAIQDWQAVEVDRNATAEVARVAANTAYLRMITCAVGALLGLAHFPLLDLVDKAIPGEDPIDS